MIVVGSRGLWGVIEDDEGKVPINGIYALTKETPERSLFPSAI